MTTKQADTVRKLLNSLEKNYGRAGIPLADEPVDRVVYQIIEGASGKKSAEAGLNRLKKNFVDWNEVRVSSDREIAGCLNEVSREDRLAIAANVKAGLEYLFDARYRDEFMLESRVEDPDEALQVLAELEGLDPGRAALVLFSSWSDGTSVLPFSAIGRILMRVGVIRKTTSVKAVVAAITELVDPKELGRLTYLLTRHGSEVCGVKSYFCTQCRAASFCSMGKRRIRAGKAARNKAARTKSTRTREKARSKK
jgi:endonuclease III